MAAISPVHLPGRAVLRSSLSHYLAVSLRSANTFSNFIDFRCQCSTTANDASLLTYLNSKSTDNPENKQPFHEDIETASSGLLGDFSGVELSTSVEKVGIELPEDASHPAKIEFPLKKIGVELPAGVNPRVKSAEFIKSSTSFSMCPSDNKPEFAVIGRSNVGKSSLINCLVNRKDLAQTSKKPGKTQLINHFLINKSWYLVDLPGYGYAKTAKERRIEWSNFTKEYFLNRENLVSVMLLIDATIPPQEIDLACASWFGENNVPVSILFTKCDRRKKAKNGGKPPHENVKAFEEAISEIYDEIPPWIMTSSVSGLGKDDVLAHLAQLRQFWKNG